MDEPRIGRRAAVEILLGVLAGAAVLVGARLGEYLVNPYNEPRLTVDRVQTWLDERRGGDNA
jgi:hypothetical protein